MPSVPSPLKEVNWQSNLQKKLFIDSEITNSQVNKSGYINKNCVVTIFFQLEDMEKLCSTTFTESQVLDKERENKNIDHDTQESYSCDGSEMITASALPSTQDFLNICSGGFDQTANTSETCDTGTSQELPNTALPTTQDLLNVCSGGFSETSSKEDALKSDIETHTFNQTNEVKNLDIDQDIISQLIDEEEMEKFKRKFDFPYLTDTQKRIVEEFEAREAASGGVLDSEDEEEVLRIKKKKKNKKKLMFSGYYDL